MEHNSWKVNSLKFGGALIRAIFLPSVGHTKKFEAWIINGLPEFT